MKRYALLLCFLLVSVATFAQTYSNANLNGSYTIQLSDPYYAVWSKTFTCPSNSSVTYSASNSTTSVQLINGVLTFDGNGNLTAAYTEMGQFNSTGSANTMQVTWNSSCVVTHVNLGHIVYQTPTTGSGSGTYTVQSNGSGSFNIIGQSGSIDFQLAATGSNGISNNAQLYSPQVNGQNIGFGSAVHQ
jgi:hypothetical protein